MSAQQLEQIEQLQATLSKMELTLEAIADAVVWVGVDEQVQWCNSSFERLVNRPNNEIIGSRFSDLLPLWQAGNPVGLELYPNTQIHQGDYAPTEYELRQTDDSLVLHISGNLADTTSDKSAILIIKDVTQQQESLRELRAEEALKASEARLNAILNSARAAIHYVKVYRNREWKTEYCSPRSLEIWGYTPEQIIADSNIHLSRFWPEDLEKVYAPALDAIMSEQNFEAEHRYLHPDGSLRWMFFNLTSVRDEAADCWRVTVISTDITENKLAQEALKASEALLNTILNSALAAIYHVRLYANGEWYFEYCSPRTLEIWGYSPEELIADKNHYFSRILPEDVENVYQPAWNASLAEQNFEGEYRYLHPDGSLRWIFFNLSSVRDEAADCWRVTIVSTDITDKKRAEEALKASEARLNAIFNSALAAIYYIRVYPNREWGTEYCSPRSLEIWGYTPEQIIAGKDFYFSNILPEDLENVHEPAMDAILAGQNYEGEYRYLHPDGSLRWIYFNLTSVRDEAADCWLVTIVSTDITEKKLAQEALKTSEARLNAILNSASAAIQYIQFYSNREWDSEYCSPRSLELWGYTPEQIIADRNTYFSRVLPEDLEKIYEPAIDAILAEQNFEAEYRYLHPDGSLRWIFFTLTSVRDVVADCWRATILATDITEMKQAEEALKVSEARLNTILNSALAAICRVRAYTNREWYFEYCSPGCVQLWGFTPEELIIDTNILVSRILPEDLENAVKKGFDAIFVAQTCEIEYRYLHPDGSLRWIAFNLTSVRDDASDCWLATMISTDITEKKLAEEALKASEARLNNILNSALVVTYRTRVYANYEWYFEYISAGSLQLWGYTSEELMADKNKYLSRIVREDLENGLQKCFEAAFAEQDCELEYRYLHPDRSLRWFSLKQTSVRDEATNSWLATLISTDITEKKLAEEALKASEARLNTILNSALAAIYLVRAYTNREWYFEYCSPGSIQLWGFTPEELMTDQNLIMSRIVPEDLEHSFINGFNAIFDEQTYQTEYRYLHPDGSLRWHSYSVTSVKDEATNSWLATFMSIDITAIKLAEQAQQRRAQAESILSNISRNFLDQDLDTAINFTLEAIAKFIDAERSTIYTYSQNQQECYLLYEWCAESIEPIADIGRSVNINQFPDIHQQLFQGKAVQLNSAVEIYQNAPEINILTASAVKSGMAVPMMHADAVVGVLIFHTVRNSKTWSQEDINFLKLVGELIAMGRARHEAETALTLAKDAAEAANRAKSMFLANMSHELRTPLNAILGFAQLMERDRTLNPKQRDSLATINRSGEHLLNLIDDVLEMSKIEAGRIVFNPETFDLLALLRIIQEMFLVRTQANQLFLKFEITPNVPRYINTDEGKLRQVLINLLGNAVKFTANGGITLRVKLGNRDWELESMNKDTQSSVSNHQSLIFEIEDTGCGIAPEEIKNLFKPFVQTSSGIHLKSGTGLGLTISREFIRLMEGEIHVRSIIGQGSTFSFDIKVNVSASSQTAGQLNSRRVVKLATNHPSVRILVVDDIQENSDLIAQLLSSTGFEVQIAVNGQEAIAQWQAWRPHLIFMDMRMPVMDGYEASREIRAREKEIEIEQRNNSASPFPPTIIIALTASAFDEQRATIIAAGCDDLVRKPFKEQVIFDKIAEYLDINYIYVDEQSSDSELKDLLMSQGTQTRSKFYNLAKIMAEDWLLQLRQAALEVDGDRILQLITQIPPTYADLTNGLTELVRRFCFDEILELTQTNTRDL